MVVGLADAAKVPRDGRGPVQVDIGPVRSLGVLCFHVTGADNLHSRCHGQDIAVVCFLLLHFSDPDEAPWHQRALLEGPFSGSDDPGEILASTDF